MTYLRIPAYVGIVLICYNSVVFAHPCCVPTRIGIIIYKKKDFTMMSAVSPLRQKNTTVLSYNYQIYVNALETFSPSTISHLF